MEDRRLLSISVIGIPDWVEQGPAPTNGGQDNTFNSNPVSGAVNALAAHPTNSDILYAGTVAGGIWRNTGATSGGSWEPLTDQFRSLAISAIAFSPLDANTLFAGTGNFISGGPNGGNIGLLRTTDAGDTWIPVGTAQLGTTPIRSVIPTAIGGSLANQVVLVGTIGAGLWRSSDGGMNFTQISGASGSTDGLDNDADGTVDEAGELNLPSNGNVQIAPDPGNTNRFYAGIASQGVFRSDNGGANWIRVNNGLTGVGAATRIEVSVSAAAGNPVYAGFVAGGALATVFRSADQGGNWAAIGVAPAVNPGNQGGTHFSILADRADPTLVYVAGDRRAGSPFFGNLFRGDSDDGSWTNMSFSLNTVFSAPHADSRDMVYDADGDILEADDGGIFRLNDPSGLISTWGNVNGNLRITQLYSAAYDHISDHIFGGTQDTGSTDGPVGSGPSAWDEVNQGDGGWASVGYSQILGVDVAIRYTMGNNFGTFNRRVVAGGNFQVGFTSQLGLSGLNGTDSGFTGFSVFPFEANRFDGTRIVIGGNGLYESTDSGDNLTVLNAGGNTGVNTIAYGGMLGGVPNEDVLYVAVGGQLFLRSTNGGALNQLTNYPGGTPKDIAMDPDNWQRVYVVSSSGVFRSTDAGANWSTITGNIGTLSGGLNTVDVFGGSTSPEDEIVVVGGASGVFRTRNPSAGANTRWSEFGGNLPNAPAVDVHYDGTDDVLVIGTHGRGAWTVPSASASLGLTGVLQIDGDTDYNNEPDVIRLVIDAANPGMLDVFLNSAVPFQVPLSAIEKINIRSWGGDDSITIDGTNGQISVPLGITIEAGADNDVVDASGGDATILGGSGSDAIIGSAGNDYISGGWGDDTITAGTGADSVFGDSDSDTIIWNNGDGSDLVEGGGGVDVLQVNGSAASGDTF
ncbi:MAG TPA: hypothetical protein VGP94_15905, partial [Tepidisphaeraceae bacterium]|nr:hypothetical protein [Tepidisphaeraceae bacterium]